MKAIACLLPAVFAVLISLAQPRSLSVTTTRTTSLIFPGPVQHVDRGSREVLVQQVPGAEHVLLVKAATSRMEPTSLSVITTDGQVYTFSVCYEVAPALWEYRLQTPTLSTESYARFILGNQRVLHGIKDAAWGMRAFVKGIYIKGDILYCQLELQNNSPLDYDLGFLRIYLRDKKGARRTASQEIELKPLQLVGNTSKVESGKTNMLVIALYRFTLPRDRFLAIELTEKQGGRDLLLKVTNKKIIKAITLPDRL